MKLKQPAPQPAKFNYVVGSMEWHRGSVSCARQRGPVIPGSAAPVKIISKGAITFAYHRVRRILLPLRAYEPAFRDPRPQ
jgi:hypothetical protein